MPSSTGLSQETWYIIVTIVGIVSGIIGYFLKKTMDKVDTHDKDINVIKQTYVSKDEMTTVKAELEGDTKAVKTELSQDIVQLTADVADIKENFLKQQDFYRSQAATDKKLDRMQESTEGKLDRINNLIMKYMGGKGNGE